MQMAPFLKVIGKIVESAKVAIRNIRRDGIEKVKASEKQKDIISTHRLPAW